MNAWESIFLQSPVNDAVTERMSYRSKVGIGQKELGFKAGWIIFAIANRC